MFRRGVRGWWACVPFGQWVWRLCDMCRVARRCTRPTVSDRRPYCYVTVVTWCAASVDAWQGPLSAQRSGADPAGDHLGGARGQRRPALPVAAVVAAFRGPVFGPQTVVRQTVVGPRAVAGAFTGRPAHGARRHDAPSSVYRSRPTPAYGDRTRRARRRRLSESTRLCGSRASAGTAWQWFPIVPA